MTCLYVSPHLDDVALSCAGSLLQRTALGQRVVVCSVFTRTGNREHDRQRQDEDRRALGSVGVEALHLGFVDAPARLHVYPSFTTLVLRARAERKLVRAVRAKLASVVEQVCPVEVFMPLGLGAHVDHRVVFAARLPGSRFYLERPYAFVHALRALRGIAAPGRPSPGRFLREMDQGACGVLLQPEERLHCGGAIADLLRQRPAPDHRISVRRIRHPAESLGPATRMIDLYASQSRWLFGRDGCGHVYKRLAGTATGWFEEEATLGKVQSPTQTAYDP